jgi:hypothetical protein
MNIFSQGSTDFPSPLLGISVRCCSLKLKTALIEAVIQKTQKVRRYPLRFLIVVSKLFTM